MLSDFRKRLAVSSITILVVGVLIGFALDPIWQFFVACFVSFLAGIAIWEYEKFAKAKGGRMILPVLVIGAVLGVVSFYLSEKKVFFEGLPLATFSLLFFILFVLYFQQREGAIVNLAVSSFGLIYVAVPVGMILGILYFQQVDGRFWLTYLLVVTKITDMGGYFGGALWGKTKLAPSISPKKTVEGAICGLVCAIVCSYFFSLLGDFSHAFHLGTVESLFLGLILGVVGQYGDLSESLLKRDANVKDSNTLPGLGGVLDALDSILFNSPIIYIYLHFVRV